MMYIAISPHQLRDAVIQLNGGTISEMSSQSSHALHGTTLAYLVHSIAISVDRVTLTVIQQLPLTLSAHSVRPEFYSCTSIISSHLKQSMPSCA